MKRRGFFTKLLLGAVAVPAIVKAKAAYEPIAETPIRTVGLAQTVNPSATGTITTTTATGNGDIFWVNASDWRIT